MRTLSDPQDTSLRPWEVIGDKFENVGVLGFSDVSFWFEVGGFCVVAKSYVDVISQFLKR